MTAGAGVVHEEKYSREFARSGGVLEMVQLWVNLPSRNKAAPPGYQTLSREAIPEVELPEGAGTLRVIAGRFGGVKGPARTFTPIDAWELRLLAGRRAALPTAGGHTTAALVLKGSVTLNESRRAGPADLVLFRREGGHILFEASEPCTILLLSGEPIDEPIAAHGPFVMNSESEIVQAIDDYRSGRMGRLG